MRLGSWSRSEPLLLSILASFGNWSFSWCRCYQNMVQKGKYQRPQLGKSWSGPEPLLLLRTLVGRFPAGWVCHVDHSLPVKTTFLLLLLVSKVLLKDRLPVTEKTKRFPKKDRKIRRRWIGLRKHPDDLQWTSKTEGGGQYHQDLLIYWTQWSIDLDDLQI